jgi:hypothetical protein
MQPFHAVASLKRIRHAVVAARVYPESDLAMPMIALIRWLIFDAQEGKYQSVKS